MACLSKSFFLFQSKSSSSDEKEAPTETECEPEKTSEYVHISIFDLPGIVVMQTILTMCVVYTPMRFFIDLFGKRVYFGQI